MHFNIKHEIILCQLDRKDHWGQDRNRLQEGKGDLDEEVIFYNCGQLGHLAKYFPNPYMTCTYYNKLEHAKKYFLQLLEKLQEKCEPNMQMVTMEIRRYHPQVCAVTRGVTRIGMDRLSRDYTSLLITTCKK